VTAASLDPDPGHIVRFAVSADGPVVRVSAAGEVDSSSAPLLRTELETVLGGDLRELVVDLDAVTFLDSAGLSVLAGAHRRTTALGVRLRVLASSRAVIRPLQITGLWDLLGAEQVEPGSGSAA
jgi:anti-sigma B factor antagonist